jgi:hypothetical protein
MFGNLPNFKRFINGNLTVFRDRILDISGYGDTFTPGRALDNLKIDTLVTRVGFTQARDEWSVHPEIAPVMIRSSVPDPFHVPAEIRPIPNVQTLNYNSVHISTNMTLDFSDVFITHFDNGAFAGMNITSIVLPFVQKLWNNIFNVVQIFIKL